ncbi:MAG: CCA tRNA nucleotidyltransferase [Nitrososphaera sp.]
MNKNLAEIATVTARALPLCEPTPGETRRLSIVADKCKMLVEDQVRSNQDVVGVVFGGSFAKGTWLRGDADIDIFVKMRTSVDLDRFEEMGKRIGLSALKKFTPKLRYSDHPYVEAVLDGIRVNVVPCYDAEQGNWKSAADRSPFHTEYIIRNFDAELKSQTRLLKSFLKSAAIYGAEISVGGFSGYVAEVLVMKYKSFAGVLAAAAELRLRQVISVGDQYDSDVVKGFTSPLIIIDPIDGRRNLGTAISPESAGKFMLVARSFLSNPSVRFFRGISRTGTAVKRLLPNIMIVEFKHRERSPDIIWGQLKRSLSAIKKQLELADFQVLRATCITDEKTSAVMAFLLESLTLAPFTKRKGPEVFRRQDLAGFLHGPKNRSHVTWVDGEMRVVILVDRKEINAVTFAKSLFGKRMENSGISKDMLADSRMLRIYSGSGAKVRGLAKEAVGEIVSTEHFIFGRV